MVEMAGDMVRYACGSNKKTKKFPLNFVLSSISTIFAVKLRRKDVSSHENEK